MRPLLLFPLLVLAAGCLATQAAWRGHIHAQCRDEASCVALREEGLERLRVCREVNGGKCPEYEEDARWIESEILRHRGVSPEEERRRGRERTKDAARRALEDEAP